MTIFGTDYSSNVNAAALATLGCSFAIPRAVMETRQIDPLFVPSVNEAIAAGQIPGGYHWLMPQNGGAQAQQYLDLITPFLNRSRGFLIQLDVEASSHDPITGKPYHPDPTWADLKAWVLAFRALSDWPIGVYSNAPFITSAAFGMPAGGLASLPGVYFWLAAYPVRYDSVSTPQQRYPGDTAVQWNRAVGGLLPEMWQFIGTTSMGASRVDIDAFRGNAAALRKLAGVRTMDASIIPPTIGDFTPGAAVYPDPARQLPPIRTNWRDASSPDGVIHNVGIYGIDTVNAAKFSAPNVAIRIEYPGGAVGDAYVGLDHLVPGSHRANPAVASAPINDAAAIKAAVNKALDAVSAAVAVQRAA